MDNFATSNGFTHTNLTQSAASGLTDPSGPRFVRSPASGSQCERAHARHICRPPKKCSSLVVALTPTPPKRAMRRTPKPWKFLMW